MIPMSSNNFSKLSITKGSNSFAHMSVTKSGNIFTNAIVVQSNRVFEGDNTASSPYGGDYATFGTIYGGGQNYGGTSHFKNRTPPPGITH